jgi:hypothetical protein
VLRGLLVLAANCFAAVLPRLDRLWWEAANLARNASIKHVFCMHGTIYFLWLHAVLLLNAARHTQSNCDTNIKSVHQLPPFLFYISKN